MCFSHCQLEEFSFSLSLDNVCLHVEVGTVSAHDQLCVLLRFIGTYFVDIQVYISDLVVLFREIHFNCDLNHR